MSKIREDFEEFCKKNQIGTEIDGDPHWRGQKYERPYTQGAWRVWNILHRKHKLGIQLEGCYNNEIGKISLQDLIEKFGLNFRGMSIDNLDYVIWEARQEKVRIEDSERVEGYKTIDLTSIAFENTVYFGADELDTVKKLAKEAIDKGNLRFRIENVRIAKDVLDGHIRDRKAWENT